MMLEGAVVNGVIVLDGGVRLPEGARCAWSRRRMTTTSSRRRSHTTGRRNWRSCRSPGRVRAGRGTDAREFLKKLAEEYNLPLAPRE